MQPRELLALDKAAQLLASAESFEDIKTIRDTAIAAQAYVKAARWGLQAQNRAAAIRIQAERKAGKWLADLKLRGGDRKSKSKEQRAPLKLEDINITRDESKRWQKEASVPEREFQHYLATANEQGREVSSAGLIRIAREFHAHRNGTVTVNGHAKVHANGDGNGNGHAHGNGKGNGKPTNSVQLLSGSSVSKRVPTPQRHANGSVKPRELVHEMENHRHLMASMLIPLCTHDDAQLTAGERKHIKYLLSQIERTLKKLSELL